MDKFSDDGSIIIQTGFEQFKPLTAGDHSAAMRHALDYIATAVGILVDEKLRASPRVVSNDD